mmetsp:Transcript_25643/g.65195  ORF Transcript_25643/g.65195 Transcript_25643/m.65195 type:complete len:356 (+) Transcript_25643:1133-2200(+)
MPRVGIAGVEPQVLNHVKARVSPRVRLEALLVHIEEHVGREEARRADDLDELGHGELVHFDTAQQRQHVLVPAHLAVGAAPPCGKLEPLDGALVADHQVECHPCTHTPEAVLGDLREGGGGEGAARVEELRLRGVGRDLGRAGRRRGVNVPRQVGLEGGDLVVLREAPDLVPVGGLHGGLGNLAHVDELDEGPQAAHRRVGDAHLSLGAALSECVAEGRALHGEDAAVGSEARAVVEDKLAVRQLRARQSLHQELMAGAEVVGLPTAGQRRGSSGRGGRGGLPAGGGSGGDARIRGGRAQWRQRCGRELFSLPGGHGIGDHLIRRPQRNGLRLCGSFVGRRGHRFVEVEGLDAQP